MEIPLYRKNKIVAYALVDECDFDRLSQQKWGLHCSHGHSYAVRFNSSRAIFMHRVVVNAKSSEVVDHKNRNGLDNRRENLRVCSRSENARNQYRRELSTRKGKVVTSKYKGVWKRGDKWRAGIRVNGKWIGIGTFSSESDAAFAYNEAATRHHGKFSLLNTIEQPMTNNEK